MLLEKRNVSYYNVAFNNAIFRNITPTLDRGYQCLPAGFSITCLQWVHRINWKVTWGSGRGS